jgi:chromosome segregation ATPase
MKAVPALDSGTSVSSATSLEVLVLRLQRLVEQERSAKAALTDALGQLSERDELLAAVSAANDSLEAERQRLTAVLALREAELAVLQHQIDEIAGDRDAAAAQIQAMRGTRAWRVMSWIWHTRDAVVSCRRSRG